VSSFLTAHQHIIGYSVPYNGNEAFDLHSESPLTAKMFWTLTPSDCRRAKIEVTQVITHCYHYTTDYLACT